MFLKMIAWVKRVLSNFFPNADISGVEPINDMESAVNLWSKMYCNKAPWVKDDVKSMNLPAAIAAEFARLVTLEMRSELSGSERANFLNEEYQQLINKLRTQIEYGCAKGGIVFKPYISSQGLKIECAQADSFYPVAFDSSGRLTSAVFCEYIHRGGQIFTRLESHEFVDNSITIKNKAYVSKSNNALGREIDLTDVPEWSELEQALVINDVDKPIYGYFKPALANNIDVGSPLGVSIYSRAVDAIRQADEQYSRLLWEFEGSELAVDVSIDALMQKGGDFKAPKLNKRLYRGLDMAGDDFYKVFSPQIRDQSLINGLNALLRKIEFLCGLSYGTLSDVQNVDKTAEEIRASKQRSYSVVADTQKALQNALIDLIDGMDVLATLYNLAPTGRIESSFEWDDSIITDRTAEFNERMQLQSSGALRPEINLAWYFGVTEEQALEMMPTNNSNNLFGGGW